ncbi:MULTISPECIES: ABC transporter permease [Halomonadaceae]|jgi:peptide/nickel transport system permease protein|uniref:Glutathione transport system permease protein GsiC n=1 Tax=Vreelandella titanicae TaxID=664683 RepID=A0A654AF17_9GAMM|nr:MULTISPECIES: ABC transporter permease [Halomonas]UEQ04786.1 ABC transporter permease [Halomonas profundus]QKS26912.1 Glutathione transport system permease protein GsiC [Halomonas titanicae]CAD5249917.1 putative peptide transporter permease subunit: membrane component of ABC superfamily [Halomonas sp. I3]CAD5272509.1 putative peptide transporter permease subunit: membrane component of ABC superfamily [Halomonas sp. 113]CAD5274290.1 putative peptide transporter permease subunit: membrane com
MWAFVFKRTLIALSVAFTISVLCFSLLQLSGDLALSIGGPEATAEQVEQIRVEYGLDRPVLEQFTTWLWGAVQLDFGRSYYYQSEVMDLVVERLPVTMTLGIFALAIALGVSIPLGVVAALKRGSWIDRMAMAIAVTGQAMPNFWFGLTLIIVFAVNLQWFPAAGSDSWQGFILPAIALGYYATPAMMRLTRSGMLEVLEADYIRTARAKGLRTGSVIFKHALRNAVIPVVALAAVELGFMLGGSVVIETVFSLRGLGQLAWNAISRNDYPVVQAIVLIIALFYIVLTLLADILNAVLDPRLRAR